MNRDPITPVSDDVIEKRVKMVAGTMILENIELSEVSKSNLRRYAKGEISYQKLMSEIKEKYQKKR